jgi:hypothetical protein
MLFTNWQSLCGYTWLMTQVNKSIIFFTPKIYKLLKIWKRSQNTKCQKGDKKQVQCCKPQLFGARVQSLIAWLTYCLVFVHSTFTLTSVGLVSSLVGQCYNLLLHLEPEVQLILWYCCKVLFLCVCDDTLTWNFTLSKANLHCSVKKKSALYQACLVCCYSGVLCRKVIRVFCMQVCCKEVTVVKCSAWQWL